MKNTFLTFAILCNLSFNVIGQSIPEFSPLSGDVTFFSEFIKHDSEYYLLNQFSNPEFKVQIYKISEDATVLDSINVREELNIFFATIKSIENKLYLGGIKSEPNSQRYIVAELDSDFSILEKYESPLFDTLISPGVNGGTSEGNFNRLFDFSVFQDTAYFMGSYFLFDTLNNQIGFQPRYAKASMVGNSLEVLIDRVVAGTPYNIFFSKNQFYIQGSNLEGPPFLPPSVGLYDGNGNYVEGWDFDAVLSGAFPWGSSGGVIDDRLYFSYRGDDQTISGCADQTATIDVRDVDFNVIERFKINECDHNFAGNMPYTKSVDGNIYFQAKSKLANKALVKKFTSDLSLIWSNEYDFSANGYLSMLPIKMVPTQDGGVILHALEAFSFVRLFKISAEGDIISSISFGNVDNKNNSNFFPNPFSDKLNYKGDQSVLLEASIYKMNGKIIQRKFDGNVLEVSDLPNGVYSIIVYDANEPNVLLHQEKVIKIK